MIPHPVPYLTWVKTLMPPVAHDLRPSGVPGRALPVSGSSVPDPTLSRRLAAAVADRHSTTADHVFLGLGTSGANVHALAALLQKGGELLCESPTYDPLWRTAAFLGAPVRFFERPPSARWAVDPLAVEARLSHTTRVVAITRLHNPTAAGTPEAVLEVLGEMAEAHDIYVLVDEVYLDFEPEAVPAFRVHPRLLTTGSLTKVYGLGWLRLGWILGDPELIRNAEQARDHSEVVLPDPPMALALANWDLLDGLCEEARARARQGARLAQQALGDLPGIDFRPDLGAPFGFLHFGGDDLALAERCAAEGAGVTPGSFFGAPGHLRIAWLGDPEATRTALSVLRGALLSRPA
ncbi:MAG: pyridoxal phosphate-dependent aminotransferase [Deltaproteobacteria bacterium]|nr:pyridoxal phosphate-dependent aminotransferase [Deltaproteobacteria bacterium]